MQDLIDRNNGDTRKFFFMTVMCQTYESLPPACRHQIVNEFVNRKMTSISFETISIRNVSGCKEKRFGYKLPAAYLGSIDKVNFDKDKRVSNNR